VTTMVNIADILQ